MGEVIDLTTQLAAITAAPRPERKCIDCGAEGVVLVGEHTRVCGSVRAWYACGRCRSKRGGAS